MSNAENKQQFPVIWNGVYETYEEAKINEVSLDSSRWIERIKEQLNNYRKEVEKFGRMALPPRLSELPMLCSLIKPKQIVDLGGSSGWLYDYMLNSIENSAVERYVIIEIEEIVEQMEKSGLHSGPVNYEKNTKSLDCVDILYANSVLQYINNDDLFMGMVDELKPDFVLVEDFLGGEFDDYYTIQNYYENRIPVKFRNRGKFVDNVIVKGYELLLSKPYPSLIHEKISMFPMESLPENRRIRYSETMLFKKLV